MLGQCKECGNQVGLLGLTNGVCKECLGNSGDSRDAERISTVSGAPVAIGNPPALSKVFFILAALSFLGGILLTVQYWPGDPGYGREWKNEAYTLSIMWFTAGVIETAVFSAIGQGLLYLHKIVENTSN